MKYTKLTYECCIERTKCDIECEFLLFIQRPFIDHLRTESGIKTQRQIKKQSFQCIKEMAVFRCFECILYFFICFIISRSPVQVRPVAPRAEIISAFYFFFFRNAFQNSICKACRTFKEFRGFGTKENGDALADMLSSKD